MPLNKCGTFFLQVCCILCDITHVIKKWRKMVQIFMCMLGFLEGSCLAHTLDNVCGCPNDLAACEAVRILLLLFMFRIRKTVEVSPCHSSEIAD